jgi:hypothetical protein
VFAARTALHSSVIRRSRHEAHLHHAQSRASVNDRGEQK